MHLESFAVCLCFVGSTEMDIPPEDDDPFTPSEPEEAGPVEMEVDK